MVEHGIALPDEFQNFSFGIGAFVEGEKNMTRRHVVYEKRMKK